MKEYIKPEAELVVFESEDVTAITDLYKINFDGGDISNILNLGEEWFV